MKLLPNDNEMFAFCEEAELLSTQITIAVPWRILIVDDDTDIHTATRFALKGHLCEDRPLTLHSVFNGKQAFEAIVASRNSLPDLLLMDMVMDSPSDGIDTTHNIRELLQQHDIPFVIIRTGQSGYINIAVIANDPTVDMVLLKSETTSTRLKVAVTEGLIESAKRSAARHART